MCTRSNDSEHTYSIQTALLISIPALWPLEQHGLPNLHMLQVLRHFAFRVDLDHKVHMTWRVVISGWSIWPEEIFALCIFGFERDVLADW